MMIKTEIFDLTNKLIEKEAYKKAGEKIINGGIVIFPTETVYGIGANAFNEESVKKIFKAKNRPQDNPLIVHISDMKMLDLVAINISEDSKKLIDKFFPGPLTLILKKNENIASNVSLGLDTVGVRMPALKQARDFIASAGVPICAPSANISGKPSITNEEYLLPEFDGKVDVILKYKKSKIGIESTVLDMSSQTPKLLRPGKITIKEIENVLNKKIEYFKESDILNPKSPGMKYAHYKPNAKVICILGTNENIKKFIINNNENASFIVNDLIYKKLDNKKNIFSFGKNVLAANKNLYSLFRQLDKEDTDIIYVKGFKTTNQTLAFMNRLLKACEMEIIRL